MSDFLTDWMMETVEGPGHMQYQYAAAGEDAPPEVQAAIKRFRDLPTSEQMGTPLLYWLLGSGTPPYKMSMEASQYTDRSLSAQLCINCKFIYHKYSTQQDICSQIRGLIAQQGWCKLWEAERA